MYRLPLTAAVAALAALTLSAPLPAGATQYQVQRTVGAATVTGTIETDGTLGPVFAGNLVDWQLEVTNGGTTVTLSGDNSVFGQVGLVLEASPSELRQPVSGGVAGFQFCLEDQVFPNVCNVGNPNWFVSASGEFVEFVRDFPSGIPDQFTDGTGAPGGTFVIATAVADSDGDGVPDAADNCIEAANADQLDTNGDGLGNACDADIDDDCSVSFGDLALLKAAFFPAPYEAVADFNGDGAVNFGDLALMKATFFNGEQPGPGPSAAPNDCD